MTRFGLCILGLLTVAVAQGDEIIFWTDAAKKQSSKLNCTIVKELPTEIAVKAGLKDTPRTFAASDVIDVVYGVDQPAYKDAIRLERAAEKYVGAERSRLLNDALRNYEGVKTGNASIARHLQFKIAILTAQLAKEDRAQGDAAVQRLTQFHKDHAKTWQSRLCLEALAELHAGRKELGQAAKAYDELRQLPGLPAQWQWSYRLAAAQALIQAGAHAEAGKRLAVMLKEAADEQVFDVRLLLAVSRAHTHFAQAVRDLEELIDLSTDARRLALAHNTLGDCYQLNKQPKEALYQYLFVDLLYREDQAELAKATDQLAKLFRLLKRPDRAKEYEEKLAKLKG